MSPARTITTLLSAWSDGDAAARARLLRLVYAELRRAARRHLGAEARGHTLSPTALVHEAYLRLVAQEGAQWQSRGQFFAVASEMMRRILVDHARRRVAGRRGGRQARVTLDPSVLPGADRDVGVIALDDALRELAQLDPRAARVVEGRFFGGLTVEETALALGISGATVERDWTAARAWLFRRLQAGDDGS